MPEVPVRRRRKGWRIVLGILLLTLITLITLGALALIPPGRRYAPAPYFAAVKQSAALPVTRGDTPRSGDRRQNRDYAFGLITEVMPFVPGRYRDLLAWALTTGAGLRTTDTQNRDMARSAMHSVRYLEEAGATLVVGSDSGNWPLFPYYFHGPTTWRELRMLADAGLSPLEILRAATVNPAKMLGLADEVGTVEVGKVADLVVVREDPLVDVEKAMRSLQYTIRAGVARTPDGWMEDW